MRQTTNPQSTHENRSAEVADILRDHIAQYRETYPLLPTFYFHSDDDRTILIELTNTPIGDLFSSPIAAFVVFGMYFHWTFIHGCSENTETRKAGRRGCSP